MRQINSRRLGAVALATVAGVALLAGCVSNSGAGGADGGATGQPGAARIIGDQGDGGAAQSGGTLSYAVYSMPASLDPAVTQPAGTTGGTEMAAVYDLLIRHDAGANTFVPNLAKSMEESADRLTWTMTLREGVTFSDGTALDAAAVVSSINRFNTKRGANSQMYTANVEKTEATAADTVEFTLKQPWSAFPSLFTFGHGMVVAPASDGADGKFTPIGAGAFTLGAFTPPDKIELKARPDYWDGKPNLDTVNVIAVKGDQAKIDTLRSGGADMIYLRNAATVNLAKKEFPGYLDPSSMAMILQINQRAGKAGSDVRVRQAIAHAVDPEVINERARDGQGMPGSEIFQSWSQWHNDVPGVQPDPAKAKQLLDEAKADGFDGKASYLAIADPDSQAVATAVQAQLNAVGFDITIDVVPTATDVVKKLYIDKDFEISFGAMSLLDPAPEIRLFSSLNSASSNNVVGANSPEIDAVLSDIQTAATHEDKLKAMEALQTLVNEQVPVANLGAGEAFVGWRENVHGVNPSLDGILLLNKAWLKK